MALQAIWDLVSRMDCAARRLNWSGAFSRAQWAPTKVLGTIHGGAGEARGGGGWVTDPPGHAKPDYALENESPAARGAGGCQGSALIGWCLLFLVMRGKW
jgi:hypothetical protein